MTTTIVQTEIGQRAWPEASTMGSPKRLARIAGSCTSQSASWEGSPLPPCTARCTSQAMRRPQRATWSPTPDSSASAWLLT